MQKVTNVSREVLNDIVGHIVEGFHLRQVSLFGPQAKGDSPRRQRPCPSHGPN